jgi:hypothetical protein
VFRRRVRGLLLSVIEAEVGMVASAGSAAAAAIGEREWTEGYAVLWTERGHRCLLRLSFEILADGKKRAQARVSVLPKSKTPARCPYRASRRYNRAPKENASRDREAQCSTEIFYRTK